MGDEFNISQKLFSWLISVAFLVSLYFLISVYKQKMELEKYRDNSIEQIKREKEKLIKANFDFIDSLKGNIRQYEIIIEKSNTTIDILLQEKAKVKIIYIQKIKGIEGLNANALANYWKDELYN